MDYEHAYFIVEHIKGKQELSAVEEYLRGLHGVESVKIDSAHNLVGVAYNSAGTSYDTIENCLNRHGYQIVADASEIHTR